VQVLVTGLGTGVGKHNLYLAKLRYDKIIIMTDADVDGSHIRTLILTLFYRHFPEIIERGYLYIAQPPLYRVVEGKREQYLKDEGALEDYLVEFGCAGVRVQGEGPGGVALEGGALKDWVRSATRYERILGALERQGKERRVVSSLLWQRQGLSRDTFADEASLRAACEGAKEVLDVWAPELSPVSFSVERDDGSGEGWLAVVRLRGNGVAEETVVDASLLASPEGAELARLAAALRGVGAGPFRVEEKDGTLSIATPAALAAHLFERARRGLEIQRYKGLGEMNPRQLWETTISPRSRTLLQVRIEDAYEADEIFSTLMGDEVEPRRRFIEENALSVKNLDV
jgi:DNA gyrase subunit B